MTITEIRHTTQKDRRICDTLEPVMSQHRLIVSRAVVEQDFESTRTMPADSGYKYQFFYQLYRITRDRGALAHDDRLEGKPLRW